VRDIKADLVELLRESGSAHHQAYIATNGEDPDWPIWYAGYLRDQINNLMGIGLTTTRYVVLLVELERARTSMDPAPDWPTYYAEQMMARYR